MGSKAIRAAHMKSKLTLTRSSIVLAFTGGVEFGLQIVIPMIFVRYLDPASFGQYRVLWLVTATVLAIAPAFMPQSLFYFLARGAPDERRTRIANVLAFLIAIGCVVGLASGSWNSLLPQTMRDMAQATGNLPSLFVALWLVVSLMNVLPTAEGRIHWQARSDIGMALARTLLLGGAAVLSSNLVWVVWAMLAEALLRLCLLFGYLHTRPGGWRFTPSRHAMNEQLCYALPFALGNAMFLLRAQADQWVVASMLPAAQFAAFSISAVFLPVGTLVRQPINNAMMARLNQAHSSGDLRECARLIAKAIGAVSMILLPVAGGLIAVTDELVQIIYTDRYGAAANIMRIYLVGIMFSSLAVGHVLTAMNEGRFAARSNAFFLLVSVLASIACTQRWGMIGAACGSVGTLIVSEAWSLRKVAMRLATSLTVLIPWNVMLPPAFACLLGLAGAHFLADFTSPSVWLRLMQKASIFATLFIAGFLAAGGWSSARSMVQHH